MLAWVKDDNSIFVFSAVSVRRWRDCVSFKRATPTSLLKLATSQSKILLSKSSPPKWVSPKVDSTSNTHHQLRELKHRFSYVVKILEAYSMIIHKKKLRLQFKGSKWQRLFPSYDSRNLITLMRGDVIMAISWLYYCWKFGSAWNEIEGWGEIKNTSNCLYRCRRKLSNNSSSLSSAPQELSLSLFSWNLIS